MKIVEYVPPSPPLEIKEDKGDDKGTHHGSREIGSTMETQSPTMIIQNWLGGLEPVSAQPPVAQEEEKMVEVADEVGRDQGLENRYRPCRGW